MWKKATSLLVSAALALSVGTGIPVSASQTFVGGTAPFINTWLVSGPFEGAVVDHLYGLSSDGGEVEIPSP